MTVNYTKKFLYKKIKTELLFFKSIKSKSLTKIEQKKFFFLTKKNVTSNLNVVKSEKIQNEENEKNVIEKKSSNKKKMNESHNWAYFRIGSLMLPSFFALNYLCLNIYPLLDYTLSVLLLYHCHTGLKSCLIDYVPKRVFKIWSPLTMKFLTMSTCVSLYGIYILTTSNNGFMNLILKFLAG